MVSEKKKKIVQELIRLIQAHPVIALVDLQNLPTPQLQNLRARLRTQNIVLTMSRKKLLTLALKNSPKPNLDQLVRKIKGLPALLLARENPFALYSLLQKNKSSAPAKPNQVAPKDIIIPAGPTNFAPGPIISELASVGIKTKVEGGKLTIIQDTLVAKEGDLISPKLAETLKRLDLQPMEIGLSLVAAWENGFLFEAQQLHIDEREYFNNLTLAFQESFCLAVEIAYPTEENIELLLQKAFQLSQSLALDQNILTDLTVAEILAKTEQQALALGSEAGIEIPEAKPEEKPAASTPEPKPEPEPCSAPGPEPEPRPEPSPLQNKKEKPKEEPGEDIPSAEEMIQATKERFARISPEKKEEVVEAKPSAEKLVEEELTLAEQEKPKKDPEVAKGEALFEKLKKQGTLRE